MSKSISRLWRAGGHGIAFTVFGFGGGLLAVIAFPLVIFFTSDPAKSHKRVRYLIHQAFRLFVWFIEAMGLFDVKVEGADRLVNRRGCLIVANHPTLLDVVVLMALSPNFQCVVKHQLWRNPFLRGVVSAAGFIRNDLSAEDYLRRCSEAFTEGHNLLLFPEGTRTAPGGFPKFVRSFANIAIFSGVDIQTVVIRCDPVALTRHNPWYIVPETKPTIRVNIGDYWEANTYGRTPHRGLNARHLTRDLETYYQDVLSNEYYSP